MSYVQGTRVRVKGEFRNPDTKALEDPPDVVVSIWQPGFNDPTSVRTYQGNDGVEKLGVGRYMTVVDTSPEAGEWHYVFESTGTDKIVKRGKLRVRPRPAVVP